jgi:hypothetical protein
MRRASRASRENSTAAAEGTEESKLPSKAVVEMFGRLFGVILRTVFEGSVKGLGGFSELGDEIRSLLREVCGFSEPKVSSGEESDLPVEAETEAEADCVRLAELKRRISGQGGNQEMSDRTVELISRSTSFFNFDHKCEYHVLPLSEKPVFDGLISFLTRTCAKNPVDKGIISVSTSTVVNDEARYQARNVADFASDSFFQSTGEPKQWICYDFKDMRVSVTHYRLLSYKYGPGNSHLRSWVVEGSEDSSNWRELDRRDDDGSLNGNDFVGSFAVRSVAESRFIRLRSTGKSWNGSDHLLLRAFELFGGLRIPESVKLGSV